MALLLTSNLMPFTRPVSRSTTHSPSLPQHQLRASRAHSSRVCTRRNSIPVSGPGPSTAPPQGVQAAPEGQVTAAVMQSMGKKIEAALATDKVRGGTWPLPLCPVFLLPLLGGGVDLTVGASRPNHRQHSGLLVPQVPRPSRCLGISPGPCKALVWPRYLPRPC